MQDRSKTIAKNAVVLYLRLLFMTFINFYTVRVILDALGIDDYGIYNVVGSFVSMFSLISSSLNTASTRFTSFALGKNDKEYAKRIFCTQMNIQMFLAIIILILGETAGLWFINYKMVIPAGRLVAANWCFQFSLLNFAINLTQVPYSSAVIAHEKMGTFAFLSIWSAIFQLILSYLVTVSPIDKLIFYGAALWLNAWVVRLMYRVYCKKKFEECTYHFIFDKKLAKEIFNFSGWNIIGSSAAILRDQGNNILLNLFFGPSVNAARGIGNKVFHIASNFTGSLNSAFSPQITKSYSSDDKEFMFKIMYKGTRMIYYLMLFLAIPLIINANYILHLWLKEVPAEAVLFGQLMFLRWGIGNLSTHLITAQLATGNIRNYQIIVGGIMMLNLPVSYIFLKMGFIPQIVIIIACFFEIFCMIARVLLLRGMIGLNAKSYFKEVVSNVFITTIVALPIPFVLAYYTEESFIRMIYTSIVGMTCSSLSIAYIGCNKEERIMILAKIRSKISKITNRN